MLKRSTCLGLSIVFLGVLQAGVQTTAAAQSAPINDAPADLILIDGQVKTPTGWAKAVAVRDGVIVAVGGNRSIKKLRNEDTKTIDLDGDTVLPGFHDVHVHPYFAGLELFDCGFPPGAAPQVIADAVKLCVDAAEPGEWVVGGNWVAAVFEPGQQNKEFLDAVAPNNPVYLIDEAHHSAWLNSKALEIVGITKDTPNPQGGIIERDSDGEANGLLRESAEAMASKFLPKPSEERKREALTLASNIMAANGITSMTIASVRAHDIGAIAALSGEGLIKQRVRGCIVWEPIPAKARQATEQLIAARASYARPRFATDCVKMFFDGVPTESHTAAMLAPYVDKADNGHDNRPEKGIMMMSQSLIEEAVANFDRQGLHIKFHVVGDAAVRAAIDAVVKAREANGWGGPMHDIGHSTFVDMADIPRARDAGMAWEFSPYIWYPTPISADDIMKAVGPERMQRFIPIKDALDSGALVTAGSDWSVVPSVNPFLAIETMVTRKNPGGGGKAIGERERVSLDDAFRILTENGALLMGQRDKVGAIEVGLKADIIVTQTNPYKVPITEVHATKVKMTFIDGEKIFDAAAPPQLTAH